MTANGFTLVELLVALTITVLLAGALAAAAPAARAAFDRVPAELDLEQRGRIAIDTLADALRSAERVAVSVPDGAGRYAELTTVTPVETAAQGVLAIDQATPGASLTLAAWLCPTLAGVCGFTTGAAAMISSGQVFDVFIVGATSAIQRQVTPSRALSRAYPAGSIVVEVEQHTFGLDEQADGTFSLARVTTAGAVQPIVDGIRSLAFQVDGRRVEVEVTLHPTGGIAQSTIDDRIVRTSITLKNSGGVSWSISEASP